MFQSIIGHQADIAAMESVKQMIQDAWEATKEVAISVWEAAMDMATYAWEDTKEMATFAWEAAIEVATYTWEAALEMVATGLDYRASFLHQEPATGDSSNQESSGQEE